MIYLATYVRIIDGNISFSRYFNERVGERERERDKKCFEGGIWRNIVDDYALRLTRGGRGCFSLFFSLSFFLSLIDYNRMLEYYSPISNAAELALTLNWFSISLGRKAAKPAISNPSLAPARFNMKKPGLPSRSVRARGSSRIFENASPRSLEDDCFLVLLWCASDTLSLANFSEPEKEIFIHANLCG